MIITISKLDSYIKKSLQANYGSTEEQLIQQLKEQLFLIFPDAEITSQKTPVKKKSTQEK